MLPASYEEGNVLDPLDERSAEQNGFKDDEVNLETTISL